MRMPESGKYYSVNEANAPNFPPAYQSYLAQLRDGVQVIVHCGIVMHFRQDGRASGLQ